MSQVLVGRQLTYEYSQIGERRIGVLDIDISLEKSQALVRVPLPNSSAAF